MRDRLLTGPGFCPHTQGWVYLERAPIFTDPTKAGDQMGPGQWRVKLGLGVPEKLSSWIIQEKPES